MQINSHGIGNQADNGFFYFQLYGNKKIIWNILKFLCFEASEGTQKALFIQAFIFFYCNRS